MTTAGSKLYTVTPHWNVCRECGLDYWNGARTTPEPRGEAQARHLGFCTLEHLAKYTKEIKAILAS
jgi:hypothetical protein